MENTTDTNTPKPTEQPAASATSDKPTPLTTPHHAKMSRSTKGILLGVGAVVLALTGGLAGALINEVFDANDSSLSILETAADDGNTVVTQDEESIAAVAKAVSPSVVSVLTSSTKASPFYNRTIEQAGAGSGIIVSSNGYILTNKHVIADADTVTVVLPNGKTYKNVSVLGTDPLNDIAVLKISGAKNLPAETSVA